MIFELKAAGLGVVLPGVVAALVLLTGCWSAGALQDDRRRRVIRFASAIAIGLGFAIGFIVSGRALGFAPGRPLFAWQWLPYLAWAAVAFGLLESSSRGPCWLWLAMRVLVSLAVASVLVPNYEFLAPHWWPLTIGLAVAMFAWWTACEPLANGRFVVAWPVVLTLTSLVTAVIEFLAGSSGLMHAAGVLFAVMAATVAVSLRYRGEALAVGMTPALAVLLPGLLFSGSVGTSSSLRITSFALVALAPMLMWLGKLRFFAQRERFSAAAILVAITCVPLVLAIVLAKIA